MDLLDTDTLSRLHAGNHRVVVRLQQTDEDVGTTIITKVELLRGRIEFLLKAATGEEILKAQQWLNRTEELLAQLKIVSFDTVAVHQFEKLQQNTRLRKVGRADLLIASIVLAHQATLVTRNLRHFQQIPGLQSLNWVD